MRDSLTILRGRRSVGDITTAFTLSASINCQNIFLSKFLPYLALQSGTLWCQMSDMCALYAYFLRHMIPSSKPIGFFFFPRKINTGIARLHSNTSALQKEKTSFPCHYRVPVQQELLFCLFRITLPMFRIYHKVCLYGTCDS